MISPLRRRLNRKGNRSNAQKISIDLYLLRLSYLSQIGLLIVATIGYFYTVVPLYQKSLLDEQIAQKELALRAKEFALSELYKELRTHSVRNFVFNSGSSCSGLLLKPENLQRRDIKISDYIANRKRVYEIDVANCLIKRFEESEPLRKNLSEDDYVYMLEEIKSVSIELENLRSTSRKEFDSLVERGISNPESLKPLDPDSFSARALELKKPYLSPNQYQKELIQFQFFNELISIPAIYGHEVREKIDELNKLEWPN